MNESQRRLIWGSVISCGGLAGLIWSEVNWRFKLSTATDNLLSIAIVGGFIVAALYVRAGGKKKDEG